MMNSASPLVKLIEQFRRLPGIGPKSAQRLAYYILEMDKEKVKKLADALVEAKNKISYCSICFNFTEANPCDICSDVKRDRSTICIVEEPRDILALERARDYRGLYHVLHGSLSPLDGRGPEDIRIKELLTRLQTDEVKEIILAMNPDVEGEATAIYISKLVKPLGIRVSRIAHGLPVGGELEYVDEVTLMKAIENRREI